MAKALVWLLFVTLIILPMLWVLSVSLQAADVVSGNRYWYYPKHVSLQAFKLVLCENYRGIRSALVYSSFFSLLATAIAMIVALSAAYLVNAQVLLLKWRRRLVLGAVGLFFLPAFAVYPGIELIEDVWPFFRISLVQLTIIHSIQAFPISFILLLVLFKELSNSDFEQLLLETGSRVKAFWWGIVARWPVGVVAVATITFTTIWSEFYITSFITTRDQVKPFSVVLQMFEGQYRTDYSSLAAGAIISLIVSFGPITLLLLFSAFLRVRDQIERKRDRDHKLIRNFRRQEYLA